MSNEQKKHDLWNLSNNLRATTAILSRLNIRAFSYAGDYTKGLDVALQIEGLLANIESLIEAANAVQYISHSITKDIMIASVDLKKKMFQYKSDLESCLDGSDDDIGVRRPRNVYDRTIPHVLDIAQRYYKILNDLNIKTEAESLMQTEQPEEVGQKASRNRAVKQAGAEKTIIEVLGNYESENGNKKGMPLAELEQETERSWIELLSVLNSLGKKQLIEIHKGEGYVPYWLPVELDESPQLRGINANVWRFRLTSAGYELLKRETSQKPAEKRGNAAPATIINIDKLNVLRDVQAENVQTGDHASIHKQPVTTEKKKGIIIKLLKIIGAIVGFLAALFTCLGYLFGWLGPIKAFICNILWSK